MVGANLIKGRLWEMSCLRDMGIYINGISLAGLNVKVIMVNIVHKDIN